MFFTSGTISRFLANNVDLVFLQPQVFIDIEVLARSISCIDQNLALEKNKKTLLHASTILVNTYK